MGFSSGGLFLLTLFTKSLLSLLCLSSDFLCMGFSSGGLFLLTLFIKSLLSLLCLSSDFLCVSFSSGGLFLLTLFIKLLLSLFCFSSDFFFCELQQRRSLLVDAVYQIAVEPVLFLAELFGWQHPAHFCEFGQ